MGKRDFIPEHLLEMNINPKNQRYVNEFKEFLSHQKLEKSSLRAYFKAIDTIFRYIKNWEISFPDYTNNIVEDFQFDLLDNEISQQRIDYFIGLLERMSNFFKDKEPEYFSRNFLKNMAKFNDSSGKNILARPLTPRELYYVKKYLNTENREKLQYIFNVFYYTDIKKSEFNLYNPQNANFEKGCYEFNGESNPFIPELEECLLKVKGKKIRFTMIDDYLPHIANHLHEKGEYEEGKTFSFEDINKTRKRYFINCPVCQKSVENVAGNWVIAQYEDSEYKQLACKNCKGVSPNE